MIADHRVTLMQIGRGALMNLGAREYVHDDPNGKIMFRIGNPRVYRKAIVTLNDADLYDVQIGRVKRRSYEWVVEAEVGMVGAEELAETLLRMHGEVSY